MIHGLNRHYYSISINYRKNELEQKMLLNLHKKSWMDGMALEDYEKHCDTNRTTVRDMLELAKSYNKVSITEKTKLIFITYLNLFILLFNRLWKTRIK